MLHRGKWIEKAWDMGRRIPKTGCWNCCGDQGKCV